MFVSLPLFLYDLWEASEKDNKKSRCLDCIGILCQYIRKEVPD